MQVRDNATFRSIICPTVVDLREGARILDQRYIVRNHTATGIHKATGVHIATGIYTSRTSYTPNPLFATTFLVITPFVTPCVITSSPLLLAPPLFVPPTYISTASPAYLYLSLATYLIISICLRNIFRNGPRHLSRYHLQNSITGYNPQGNAPLEVR